MDINDLLKLIDDDDLGLLKVKPKQAISTADDRLSSSFNEINDFYKTNGREPSSGGDISEHQLYARLKGIRQSQEKVLALLPLDEHGLLNQKAKEVKSIEDIFGDDDLGILDNADDNIFDLKHVSKETTMPEYVARRKKCRDFSLFEEKLKQCQRDLTSGKRKLHKFQKEQQIEEGSFFILKGILLYVAFVGEKEVVNGKQNARLRCIFENGTESDMLLRSLAAELYKDGRRITENEDNLLNNFQNITEEDEETGYIYVLKSLSENPDIKCIDNLYKIGFSKIEVEERIKNASQEPTYLMAAVSIVMAFKCFNVNPQKFEQLLHKFFGSSCLNLDIFDKNNRRYTPREWFVVPLPIIEQVINLILDGEIIHYKYDADKEQIIKNN